MTKEEEKNWKKSWVSWLWKAWFALASFCVLLTGVISGIFDEKTLSSSAWKVLLETHSWPLVYFILSVLITALIVGVGFIAFINIWDDQRISEAENKIKLAEEKRDDYERRLQKKGIELENLEELFRDRERIRMLDHVTGIPNFESWEEDLKNWASKGRNKNDFSLILIDLDNLRWLNERSRDCADLVLRAFARKTYEAMRRNEQLYKAPDKIINVDYNDSYIEPSSTASRMYRHYQGGDEFFFIISGDVYAAVGFTNRLAIDAKKYKKQIHDEILLNFMDSTDSSAFQLSFSATIAPIHPGTNPKTALSNAYRILDRAKKSNPRLLVVFEDSYEHVGAHRAKLEKQKENIEADLQMGIEGGGPTDRIIDELDKQIKILRQGEQIFSTKENLEHRNS